PTDLPTVAVFDFDGTLTLRDSFLPFLRAIAGRQRYWLGLLKLSPVLLAYGFKRIPNWQAKEAMLIHFLSGISTARLAVVSEQFARRALPKLLRPEAIARLAWHQQQGHQTIIVSASLEAYLQPCAALMGIDQVVGTRLKSRDGYITGRMLGKNCYGPEKAVRLQAILSDLQQPASACRLYAYGDSRGDRELLAMANYPYYRKF
ncbi:MAG: HAD family hydrolase, partial [Phormidesmis sp.]